MIEDKTEFSSITEKQREVMSLLVEFKTSKEIARLLSISPHTVDQRINFVRKKLNVSSRSEAASKYRRLSEVYDKPIYEDSDVPKPDILAKVNVQDEAEKLLIVKHPEPSGLDGVADQKQFNRIGPRVFVGKFGTLARIVAILLIGLTLMVIGVLGLAVFQQLSQIFAT
ncbi:helix-turn-helix domain-containing protein [Alteripontixanthobacter maritimus]|nr:helix-turn-helix transcriptional regulator [Alteripontixanthobacter maritimus]